MFEGPVVAAALAESGITDVVWIPDSELGRWDEALQSNPDLRLIRVCREGEALAVAAGLWLGGRRPIVLVQCTGLFEAGDSLRNVIHDLQLPLFLVVGVRGYYAHQQGTGSDNCPLFTEPILQAWRIPYTVLTREHGPADLAAAYRQTLAERRPGVVLLAE